MTEPIEKLAEALETFDRRLSSIDQRFVKVEGHMADGASAGEEMARQLHNISESVKKLTDLFQSIDTEQKQTNTMLSNYVDATKGLRREAQQLISEVREKLKVAGG